MNPRRELRGALPVHLDSLVLKHVQLAAEKGLELSNRPRSARLPLIDMRHDAAKHKIVAWLHVH